jgi:hypothetical protein
MRPVFEVIAKPPPIITALSHAMSGKTYEYDAEDTFRGIVRRIKDCLQDIAYSFRLSDPDGKGAAAEAQCGSINGLLCKLFDTPSLALRRMIVDEIVTAVHGNDGSIPVDALPEFLQAQEALLTTQPPGLTLDDLRPTLEAYFKKPDPEKFETIIVKLLPRDGADDASNTFLTEYSNLICRYRAYLALKVHFEEIDKHLAKYGKPLSDDAILKNFLDAQVQNLRKQVATKDRELGSRIQELDNLERAKQELERRRDELTKEMPTLETTLAADLETRRAHCEETKGKVASGMDGCAKIQDLVPN